MPFTEGLKYLRSLAESNRRPRFCRPLPSHSAKEPCFFGAKELLSFFRTAKVIIF